MKFPIYENSSLSMKFPFYENSYLSMKLPVINIFWLWNLLSMQCPIFEMFCPWNVFLYNVLTPNCLGWRVGSKPDRSKPSCNLWSWLEPQYRYTGTAGEHFFFYFFNNYHLGLNIFEYMSIDICSTILVKTTRELVEQAVCGSTTSHYLLSLVYCIRIHSTSLEL